MYQLKYLATFPMLATVVKVGPCKALFRLRPGPMRRVQPREASERFCLENASLRSSTTKGLLQYLEQAEDDEAGGGGEAGEEDHHRRG